MSDEKFWYGTVFDHVQCDEITKKGRQCRMVPVWEDKATGKRLCPIHADLRFNELREAHEKSQ